MTVLLAVSDPRCVKIWSIHLTNLRMEVTQTASNQIALHTLVQVEFYIIILNLDPTGGGVMVLADYAASHWPKNLIILLT